MSREILFRGREKGYKPNPDFPSRWYEGYLARADLIFSWSKSSLEEIFGAKKSDNPTYFYNEYQVDPNTVGQFTGLTDKNGKKIFEGDIVHNEVWDVNYEVQILEGHFTLVNGGKYGFDASYFEEEMKFLTVIGNIHDNPELLEVKDE